MNSAGAGEALKTSLLQLSDTPRFVISNAEAVYRKTADLTTRSSTDLRRDITRAADPNVLTVWSMTVGADFDGLWTAAIQAKEASEAEKKLKLANKRKQRKGVKGCEAQADDITSTTGDSGGGAPEAGDLTPEDDADEDVGEDWRTCTVSLKQVLREELINEEDEEDDYHRILSLLDESQAYATNIADAIFTMVHKETILVSCANLWSRHAIRPF